MADEVQTTTAPEAVAEATVSTIETTATAPRFTQEDLNRAAGKAREEGRRSALKEKAPDPKPVEAAQAKDDGNEKLSLKGLQAQLDEERARRAFDKHAAKRDLTDEQADDLFFLHQHQKPADTAEWLARKAPALAKELPVSTPPTATTAAPVATAAAPIAPARVDGTTNAGMQDVFQLSIAQMEQLGPAGMRAIFEQATSMGRQLSGAPMRPKLPTQQR